MHPFKVKDLMELHDVSKIYTAELDWGAQFKLIPTITWVGKADKPPICSVQLADSDISKDQILKTGNVCFTGLKVL